jgi:hypothetical protein
MCLANGYKKHSQRCSFHRAKNGKSKGNAKKTSKLKEPQKEPTARERAIKMKNW